MALFLPRLFVSGIRAKLAWFTGSLIFLTILTISIINLRQQNQILSESYEREAAISRKYISSLVLELDNIAQSLIHIEQFRARVSRQRAALRKYRTVRTFTAQKQVSFLGFKTTLFGALGERKYRRSLETYYSEYLSDADIQQLERRTRARLQVPGTGNVTDREFNQLAYFAKQLVEADQTLEELQKRQAELREAIARKTPAKSGQATGQAPATEVDEQVKAAAVARYQKRFALDTGIATLLAASRQKKIKELGLDTGRFRIQTFPLGAIVPGREAQPTLDTKIFDPGSPLNEDIKHPKLEDGLRAALTALTENVATSAEASATELSHNSMELQALYSPHFRNPASSARARTLEGLRDKGELWRPYLEQDEALLPAIAATSAQISKRVTELRGQRYPVPPYKDAVFRKHYQAYQALIKKRDTAFEEFAKTLPKDHSKTADAVRYLRDSALEDSVLIRFEPDSTAYETYLRSTETRSQHQQRWLELRQWIYGGYSETPPARLKALYPDGILANSRTEAEQALWRLDASPLISNKAEDVAGSVLGTNFAGIIRTLVNRTAGVAAIAANRNRAVLSALAITAAAILLAVFFSGFVVQKIKRIITSAEAVGQGNLSLVFEHGGADEFGKLTVALNHMVGGLREREKIKGILGSMVDPVVIGEAMKDLEALKRGTETRITAFFSDVAGFSSISEKLSSVELAALLNEYLSAMTIILKEEEGVLDKYIGDAIVGIFNAPVPVAQHAYRAVKASIRMQARLAELREQWRRDNAYIHEAREMQFRIGLHTGLAKVGFMGTDALASYTMMGDTVNLAARLEAAGKDYGVSVLCSKAVYDEVHDSVFARRLDLVRVKGKTEPVEIYEVISLAEEPPPQNLIASTEAFSKAFEKYLAREWKSAVKHFEESLKIRGTPDKSATLLIDRCEHYRKNAPPGDWDGVFTRDHK